MAKVDRVVGYAGVSVVVNEDGSVTRNFHTSNNKKYAVWAMLPETVLGAGKSVAFTWFKLPADTTKTGAIQTLLGLTPDVEVKNMLTAVLEKSAPKPKKEKVAKAPKAKKAKVTVEVKDKKPVNPDVVAKIKALAEKRKAAA